MRQTFMAGVLAERRFAQGQGFFAFGELECTVAAEPDSRRGGDSQERMVADLGEGKNSSIKLYNAEL